MGPNVLVFERVLQVHCSGRHCIHAARATVSSTWSLFMKTHFLSPIQFSQLRRPHPAVTSASQFFAHSLNVTPCIPLNIYRCYTETSSHSCAAKLKYGPVICSVTYVCVCVVTCHTHVCACHTSDSTLK